MSIIQYCTPEWLTESKIRYRKNPKFKKALQKLTINIAFRIKADRELGIDQDIIFAAYVDKGELTKLSFISEADAEEEMDYILTATPARWTKILRKESMFAGDVLAGKIVIEKGSKPGVIKIAPHSTTFVDALTQVDLQFPDEMSAEELAHYRDYINNFRVELDV